MIKDGDIRNQAVRQFFDTTTLHGFKYLLSNIYLDRLGWLICCGTSTVCAGLLCTVLWARFLEVPAVLELQDHPANDIDNKYLPDMAVCPPVDASAALLASSLTSDTALADEAKRSIARLLSARPTSLWSLRRLEVLLTVNNTTLSELVLTHMPSCSELVLKCRWQQTMVPCQTLFVKELTPWGSCCVMRPLQVVNIQLIRTRYTTTKDLDLVLKCSGRRTQGCRFYTTFEVEETVEPMMIIPGRNYFAQLWFSSIPQNSVDEIIGSACSSDKGYSKADCLAKCGEKACRCINPLHPQKYVAESYLPPCTVTQLECLSVKQNDGSCNCLPCCNKITTHGSLESGRMEVLRAVLDPLYSDLNVSASVLHLKVYTSISRIFTMNPTETWISLLSSLGGVFNMFLGMGLFSALEIVILLVVKLPIDFKNSAEIRNPPPRY